MENISWTRCNSIEYIKWFSTTKHPCIWWCKKGSDDYPFSGSNSESEGENINFETNDQLQAAPPPSDPYPQAPNEDIYVHKPRHHGQGPAKQYPRPVWNHDENDRSWRANLTTRKYPVTFGTHQEPVNYFCCCLSKKLLCYKKQLIT